VMRIGYLADHMHFAPKLADWHSREWADHLPGWTPAEAEAELRTHMGQRQVPTTLVAIEDGQILGSASLLVSDLVDWDYLSPWVASVFVAPEHRGRGLGRMLVERAVLESAALDIATVYLYTAGQVEFYRRLGWEAWQPAVLNGHPVTVMRRSTRS